jgi:hypothetical protein
VSLSVRAIEGHICRASCKVGVGSRLELGYTVRNLDAECSRRSLRGGFTPRDLDDAAGRIGGIGSDAGSSSGWSGSLTGFRGTALLVRSQLSEYLAQGGHLVLLEFP